MRNPPFTFERAQATAGALQDFLGAPEVRARHLSESEYIDYTHPQEESEGTPLQIKKRYKLLVPHLRAYPETDFNKSLELPLGQVVRGGIGYFDKNFLGEVGGTETLIYFDINHYRARIARIITLGPGRAMWRAEEGSIYVVTNYPEIVKAGGTYRTALDALGIDPDKPTREVSDHLAHSLLNNQQEMDFTPLSLTPDQIKTCINLGIMEMDERLNGIGRAVVDQIRTQVRGV